MHAGIGGTDEIKSFGKGKALNDDVGITIVKALPVLLQEAVE
jgi:hypothetical protein